MGFVCVGDDELPPAVPHVIKLSSVIHSHPGSVCLFCIFFQRGDVGRYFNRFQVLPEMSVFPPTAKLKC